jgi:hypothetical protein
MMNKLEGDHDLLKALHIILYKGPGSKATRKKDIRAFNGYPPGTDVGSIKAKVEANKKWTVSVLKDACVLLGLEKSGDRDALINRLFDFLMKPHAIAKPAPPKVRAPAPAPARVPCALPCRFVPCRACPPLPSSRSAFRSIDRCSGTDC